MSVPLCHDADTTSEVPLKLFLCNEVIADLDFARQCVFARETGYDGLLSRPAEFAKKVKVFYVSMGSKEGAGTGRSIHEALEKAGVKHTYYEAPGTAHEFQTWRKSLHGFAQLLFRK